MAWEQASYDDGLDAGHESDYVLARAARAWGRQALAGRARRLIYRLQRLPATGIYGNDEGLRTVWDEYCFEVRNGPTYGLEWAWQSLIGPHVTALGSPGDDALGVVLSAAAAFELADPAFDHDPGHYPDLIEKGIMSILNGMAAERRLNTDRRA